MRLLLALLVAGLVTALLLTNCQVSDPMGATTRERIRSDGAVRVAEAEAHARAEVARYKAEAEIATTRTWATILPTALLIIVGGLLAGIVLYFQGRAYLMRIDALTPAGGLSRHRRRQLEAYAQETGCILEVVDDSYYLLDKQSGKRIRAIPRR